MAKQSTQKTASSTGQTTVDKEQQKLVSVTLYCVSHPELCQNNQWTNLVIMHDPTITHLMPVSHTLHPGTSEILTYDCMTLQWDIQTQALIHTCRLIISSVDPREFIIEVEIIYLSLFCVGFRLQVVSFNLKGYKNIVCLFVNYKKYCLRK